MTAVQILVSGRNTTIVSNVSPETQTLMKALCAAFSYCEVCVRLRLRTLCAYESEHTQVSVDNKTYVAFCWLVFGLNMSAGCMKHLENPLDLLRFSSSFHVVSRVCIESEEFVYVDIVYVESVEFM